MLGADDVRNYGAEEDIWILQTGSNMRMGKIA